MHSLNPPYRSTSATVRTRLDTAPAFRTPIITLHHSRESLAPGNFAARSMEFWVIIPGNLFLVSGSRLGESIPTRFKVTPLYLFLQAVVFVITPSDPHEFSGSATRSSAF